MNDYRISEEKLKELKPQIEKWKETYGEDRVVFISLDTDPVDAIFKTPLSTTLEKSKNMDGPDYVKNQQLLLDCVLYPSPADFGVILEEKDVIISPLSRKLVTASGAAQTATVKKL